MKQFSSAFLVLLALVSCHPDLTQDERRWRRLEGEKVWVVTGYSTLVHANKECPALAQAKGEVTECRVEHGRLVDQKGLFVGSARERQPVCEQCVR